MADTFWRRHPWLALAGAFAGSRIVIAAIGFIGVAAFVDHRALVVVGAPAFDPAVVWHKWDALWYERIARHGYGWEIETLRGQAAAGFFPLYPVTVGLLLQILPSASFFWVGSAFSSLTSFAALVLIARHLTRDADETMRVVGMLLTAAGSFYLSIPYTEGLFLLLVVLAMITTEQRRYWLAGLLCGLATTTRAHGLALLAIPLLATWTDKTLPPGRKAAHLAGLVILFAIPVAVYMAHLADVQGSAQAFVERQALWSNALPFPFRAVAGLVQFPRRINGWLHGGFWLLYALLLVRCWRRLTPGEALYCAGALIISTQQEIFQGTYRYVVPLVPLMVALSREPATVRHVLLAINLIFGTIMILAFVTGNRLAV